MSRVYLLPPQSQDFVQPCLGQDQQADGNNHRREDDPLGFGVGQRLPRARKLNLAQQPLSFLLFLLCQMPARVAAVEADSHAFAPVEKP